MACCAFAAFLIGQIVYGLRGLWDRLRGVAEDVDSSVLDEAAAWRLGAPALALPAPASRRSWRPMLLGGAVAVELAMLAGGGVLLARPRDALQGVAILCHADHIRTALAGGLIRNENGEPPR